MKKYFENWTNPNTNQIEQIEVVEFSFDDFENGVISGNWQAGKQLLFYEAQNKFKYEYLPLSEVEKIRERQVQYYNEKIDDQLKLFIGNFIGRYNKSENKDRLFKTEVDKYEKLLFPEKMPLNRIILCNTDYPIDGCRYNSIQIDSIRKLYQQIVVNGQKDYSFTNSPNMRVHVGSGDHWNVQVEAISKFYNWLKDEFAKNPDVAIKVFSFDSFIKENGIIDRFKQKEITINSNYNFELLLESRLKLYEEHQIKLIEDRELNRLETKDFELELFYLIWLNSELANVERWLASRYSNGNKTTINKNIPNPIEIYKYKVYLQDEKSKVEKLTNKARVNETINTEVISNKKQMTDTKLSFTKQKLRPIILELASLDGYEDPIIYLNDLLEKVKAFDDFEFTCNFYLNVHYLCKEYADKFWCESHKQQITKWLKSSGISTDVFDRTWNSSKSNKTEASILSELSLSQNQEKKQFQEQKQINIPNQSIIENLYNELKGYFTGREIDLKRALQGELISNPLTFPHNQNKFVEVFRRLKYNNFTLNTLTEIRDWLCKTFRFKYKKGLVEEIREFNKNSVWDLLTKAKGEPPKRERICQTDWLPYKSHTQVQKEAQKEKI